MCGERNAIANMITHGENEIIKLVCVDSRGNVGSPCGACREYMMQLSKDSKNIEILKDIDSKEIVKLEELLPDSVHRRSRLYRQEIRSRRWRR
jgi:cytidine deaminase